MKVIWDENCSKAEKKNFYARANLSITLQQAPFQTFSILMNFYVNYSILKLKKVMNAIVTLTHGPHVTSGYIRHRF